MDNDLIIPGWAVVLLSTLGGSCVYWFIWLTIRSFSNEKAIALINMKDGAHTTELEKIDKKIERLDNKFDKVYEQLNKITK